MKKHEWNVVIVEKHGLPRAPQKEFQVESKSLVGASMTAARKLKSDYDGWKIKSIWWLNPNRVQR